MNDCTRMEYELRIMTYFALLQHNSFSFTCNHTDQEFRLFLREHLSSFVGRPFQTKNQPFGSFWILELDFRLQDFRVQGSTIYE